MATENSWQEEGSGSKRRVKATKVVVSQEIGQADTRGALGENRELCEDSLAVSHPAKAMREESEAHRSLSAEELLDSYAHPGLEKPC